MARDKRACVRCGRIWNLDRMKMVPKMVSKHVVVHQYFCDDDCAYPKEGGDNARQAASGD